MKTPMRSFLGSPLLNSNMLQTLFPTSIPLIRTNLALYLLYDFSCLPFSFRLLRFFFARDIFLWLLLIVQKPYSASAISTSPSLSASFPLSSSSVSSPELSSASSSTNFSATFSVSFCSSPELSSSVSSSSSVSFPAFSFPFASFSKTTIISLRTPSTSFFIPSVVFVCPAFCSSFISLPHCLIHCLIALFFFVWAAISASIPAILTAISVAIFVTVLVTHSRHSLSALFPSSSSSSFSRPPPRLPRPRPPPLPRLRLFPSSSVFSSLCPFLCLYWPLPFSASPSFLPPSSHTSVSNFGFFRTTFFPLCFLVYQWFFFFFFF